LIPSIHLSELKYIIQIDSLPETSPTDLQKVNDTYKTANVNVSYGGNYIFILQSVHLLYKYTTRINFCFIRSLRINF
jgi:hypothetical protein